MSLFLLSTLFISSNIPLIHSNNITCGFKECQNQQQCNEGEDCTFICNGNQACKGAIIVCPVDYTCTITCSGNGACEGAMINGSSSSELIINGCIGGKRCIDSEIHCPPNNGTSKRCSISGDNNIRNNIKYYAINGWSDVNTIGYTGDHSIDNSNMFCLSDYSLSCFLADTSFECDPNGDTFCNDGITPLPTTSPTNIPTISPTMPLTTTPTISPTVQPTLEPTINPSFQPTLEPTVQPTINPTIKLRELQISVYINVSVY